jgi:hypothetical protein
MNGTYEVTVTAESNGVAESDTRVLSVRELGDWLAANARDAWEWGVPTRVAVDGRHVATFGPDEPYATACPSQYGPGHDWLVLAAEHSPIAPYGCQHCEARTIGATLPRPRALDADREATLCARLAAS